MSTENGRLDGEQPAEKESLVEGNTTDLGPVCALLARGLKQGPTAAPWDMETVLYGADEWAEYGITDGWAWATDGATALMVLSDKWLDIDSRTERGRQVVGLCGRDFPAPIYALTSRDVVMIGGVGIIPGIGLLDLDRLRDAVLWAAEDGDQVVVACDEMKGGPLLRIAGPGGRVAVVIGMTMIEGVVDGWRPTIDLPLRDVTEEANRARS